MEDWSSTARSDIFHFVPYTWTINLIIKEFELVLLTNEYNWIDTSSSQTENGKYSQICIKRSPLGQRKSGLIRQVTS
jgi:hypothetical protein